MLASHANGRLGLVQSVVFALAALTASLISPPLALLLAWVGVLVSAREAPEHVSWPLVAFAHAGALIFASRTFEDASSDFAGYFAVYEATCHATSGLEDTLLAFGPEIGLPAFYQVLSALGLCGLSVNGLAWLQGFITATALLLVISRRMKQDTPANELPMALAGLCLMFSFFFVTQLSRQAVSSVFVLAALWLARSRRDVFILLALGTSFHLTAPLIWGLCVLLRGRIQRALPALILVAAIPILAFDQIVAFAVEHVDAFGPLAKLTMYALPAGDDGGPSSDLQGVVQLAFAGALFAWRARREPALAADSRLLLGLAVIALAMLPVPFASTRTTLPIAWLAIGAFLFRGLAGTARPLGWLALAALLALRVVSASMPGQGAHALWFAYPPAGWIPGYWLLAF
jgi:hypothetical protein